MAFFLMQGYVLHSLNLAFVRGLVKATYAQRGHPSIDLVVFFKLQLVMFFEDIRKAFFLIGEFLTAFFNRLFHFIARREQIGFLSNYETQRTPSCSLEAADKPEPMVLLPKQEP